jgi:hypothetical protein
MAQGLNSSLTGNSQRAVVWVPPGTGVTRVEVRQDASGIGAAHLLRLFVTYGTAGDSQRIASSAAAGILSGSASGEVLLAMLGNPAATQQLRSFSRGGAALIGLAGILTQNPTAMSGLLPIVEVRRRAAPFVIASVDAASWLPRRTTAACGQRLLARVTAYFSNSQKSAPIVGVAVVYSNARSETYGRATGFVSVLTLPPGTSNLVQRMSIQQVREGRLQCQQTV